MLNVNCSAQESGRAGRDGILAKCYIFFSYRDKSKLQSMIIKARDESGASFPQHNRNMQIDNLLSSVSFCVNDVDCRRKLLLNYFGENFDPQQCRNTCDNCCNATAISTLTVTAHAQLICAIVKAVEAPRSGRGGGGVTRLTFLKMAKLYTASAAGKDKDTAKYIAALPVIADCLKKRDDLIAKEGGKDKQNKLTKILVERLLMEMVVKKYLDEDVEENGMGFSNGEFVCEAAYVFHSVKSSSCADIFAYGKNSLRMCGNTFSVNDFCTVLCLQTI